MDIKPSNLSGWLVPALFTLLSCAVLVNALPSLAARMALLPGDEARDALLSRGTSAEATLDTLNSTRRRALTWRATSETCNDLALYDLTRARRAEAGSNPPPQEIWREAIRWQSRALGRAPADTYGWARLAYMMMQTEGLTDATAATLAHSFDTGPYEPSLQLFRLVMAVSLFDKLDKDTKDSMPFMIRAAWEHDPSGLAKAARDNHFISLAEQALADDPEKLAEFREKLPAAKGNQAPQDQE
jgi:hypothetical protein